MSDIVERLVDPRYCGQEAMRSEAAETILALRAEVEAAKAEGAAMWRCGVSDTIVLVGRVRRIFERERRLKRNSALSRMDAELDIALQDWIRHSRIVRPSDYKEADAAFKDFSSQSHIPAALSTTEAK